MSDTEVVSGATETATSSSSESSSASTQTANESAWTSETTSTAETTQQQEKRDWRKLQREDTELNAYIQSQIAKDRQRRERAALRAEAKRAHETQDADT